jgi:uncharacterized protein YigE (DUF2233 family)
MLVIGGMLHPRFREGSDSLNIRNGVGTSADGSRAVFAISNRPVNFHAFARLFRDGLGLPDALTSTGGCRGSTRPAWAGRTSAPRWGRWWACWPPRPRP